MYFKITVTQRMGDVYDSGYFSAIKEKMVNSSWSEVRNGSMIKIQLMVPDEKSITSKVAAWKAMWGQMSEQFSNLMERDEVKKLWDARPTSMRDFIIMYDEELYEYFESDEHFTCGIYYAKLEDGLNRFRHYYSSIRHIRFDVEDGIRTTGLVPSFFESDQVPEDIREINELLEIMYGEWKDLVPYPSR
jgi:hypothetical protein